ncbi:hypothetical protein MVI27_09785 [Chryseobacterium salipaludis]|uniref:hypothetical protein n=1 Tax=Chryseobacterium TaxID=59732 RepID=UPI001FF50CFA|nr:MULTISPECIES: hypothetical protein [Chryseobacterium]MCJ8498551.1 hypothetical protein [Chryseobacterium salipaludis]MCX3297124.1 hypothetical protein [Planobacterium sp. JC490]
MAETIQQQNTGTQFTDLDATRLTALIRNAIDTADSLADMAAAEKNKTMLHAAQGLEAVLTAALEKCEKIENSL